MTKNFHFIFTVHVFMLIACLCFVSKGVSAQEWTTDGNAYYLLKGNEIIRYSMPMNMPDIVVTNEMLIPAGQSKPIRVAHYSYSADQQKFLLFTNTKQVWRIKTRGDYWLFDLKNKSLKQLGQSLPAASLMFAKFSPDSKFIAYVSNNNIYVEDLETSVIRPVTNDGTKTLINGTFDWVYEEEFFCRDGFRWSPDSKHIAYWQLDASEVGSFYMINNTDSIRPQIIPIEYPLVGEKPSSCRIGVVDIAGVGTTWMQVPGQPDQNYIVRMEFIPWSGQLLLNQLNRKQNESRIYIADKKSGLCNLIYEESDQAWVEYSQFDITENDTYRVDFAQGFDWFKESQSIIWASEKDGWRQLFEVSLNGKPERKITQGSYDVVELKATDARNGYVYFTASPDNATGKYLYRTKIDGRGKLQLMSPPSLKGTHNYELSPDAKYAFHVFSNHFIKPSKELITVSDGKAVNGKTLIDKVDSLKIIPYLEFFTVKTADSVTMDGWMVKPKDFDPLKKYPVVFEVYAEPWATSVKDEFGSGRNHLYKGNMAEDGYIYIAVDGRGTPALKGSAWRKSIYRQIGRLNIHDQAMAAAEILKWSFIDPDRVAVWGWSGGGTTTLHLMFQYPEIYKTGIAIAAVSNLLTYDNVYTERYMGLPQENMEDFINGSPVTYAKNLSGNLLIIHGTGDDNVHYQNAEMLLNELIKYKKKFQIMPYPNRSHNISEGEGTGTHLQNLYTDFLKKNCPPGGK